MIVGSCKGSVSEVVYNALWDLYNSTNGIHWTWSTQLPASTIWTFPSNLSTPCSHDWQGLVCSSESQNNTCSVEKIVLNSYGLRGYLPSSLGNILSLKTLKLSENYLTGTVPKELGNLQSMLELWMYTNNLSGTIPCELGSLQSMQSLVLHTNQLSGAIPFELGSLISMQELLLNNNVLSGVIPDELGYLSLLKVLLLYTNQLTGSIPTESGNLQLIVLMNLFSNHLSGPIPSELGNLPQLEYLLLYSNGLSAVIPSELGSLRTLRALYLDSNRLSGKIPCELGALSAMENLDLSSNCLSGTIPKELEYLQSLKYLLLSSCSLSGTIPSELGNLTSLEMLALFSNSLTGTIPGDLRSSKLQSLLLYANSLTGTLPYELGARQSLQVMFLGSNKLSGTLSGALISNWTQLSSLDLSANIFSGSIPVEISLLNRTLSVLFTSNNLFTGAITNELGSCSKLEKLDVSNNFFSGNMLGLGNLLAATQINVAQNVLSGAIPEAFNNFHLESVDLSDNWIEGSLGAFQFANCSYLKNIALGNNMLTGEIPDYLSQLPSLLSFNASGNELSGDLSGFILLSGSLQSLDVSSNRLTGTLPAQLFEQLSLHDVLLFSNCFSGTLPETICSNSALEYVVMNQLTSNCGSGIPKSLQPIFQGSVSKRLMTGSIPDCVWGMSGLKLLQLSGNGLMGSIGEYKNRSSLVSLLLSGNRLTGTIPTWIQISSVLEQLDLSSNQLSGSITRFVWLSLPLSSLFKVSVNRLSGNLPIALFSPTQNLSIDVLNGNQFSCSSAGGVASWGSALSAESLPQSDPNHASYVCGSSLFDNYLLATVLLLVLLAASVVGTFIIQPPYVGHWTSGISKKNSFCTIPQLNSWIFLAVLSGALLVLFACLHSCSSLAQFSTHSETYLWMTTAAFLRGWAPVVVILLAVGVGEIGVVMMCHGIFGSSHSSSFLVTQIQWSMLLISSIHFLNVVAVISINAAYVYTTVNGLSHRLLFVIQLFLGCFKLVWSGTAIPWFLRVFARDRTTMNHRVFMSLFSFIGGPFISTFFSASNCFLYILIPQAAVASTIVVPRYSCSSICDWFCNDDLCHFQFQFKCPSVCEFEQASITATSMPSWIYSYQCSSTLLLDYVPVMIASMAVSGLLLPCLVIVAGGRLLVSPILRRLIPQSMAVGDNFDASKFGQFLRVKTSVNITTMLTFGFASPLLGVLVLVDTVSWNGAWQLLMSQQIEYLKFNIVMNSFAAKMESRDESGLVSFSTDQVPKETTLSSSDSLMVLAFVGVFWSLFVFDMIGDVYGDLSGGLSMLVPLLMGALIWWAVTRGKVKADGQSVCDDYIRFGAH